MKEVLIVKYGEIALRGKNRFLFERQLINSIKQNIKEFLGYRIIKEQGRFIVEKEEGNVCFSHIIPRITTVLGIIGVCPCVKLDEKSLEDIRSVALAHMQEFHSNRQISFKVETKRADRTYPIPSREVSAEVGGYCLENMENLKVDVHNPEVTLNIEIRNHVYIYSKEYKGFGGLPVGSSGKALVLLSAGIDSPVATFLMAKRGVLVEAIYFHSPPYTSEKALQKVQDVALRLRNFTGSLKLHVVNFTEIQMKLLEKTPPEKLTLLLKRTMLRVAEKIAIKNDCSALATGDSIGQVASQTIKSLAAMESAVSLPIIRPLSGMDKNEIIDIAKKIDTFEISIRPFDDCCTLFVAKHPETKPKISIIENVERNIEGLDELIERAVMESSLDSI